MLVLLVAAALVVPEPELCCGWQDAAFETARSSLTFVVEAELQNLEHVAAVALAVSDPSSPEYTNYRSQAQLDALTAPHPQHASSIRSFLQGLTVHEVKGRRFEVTCSLAEAERLFQTTFRALVNSETGQEALRASSYALPGALAGAAVFGLHGLPLRPKPNLPVHDSPASVTPKVINSQYGVSGVEVSRSSKNSQAVAEFQGQTMSSKDLTQFFQKFVPSAQPGDDTVSKFVGDAGDKSGQVEASLDVQFMMGVAPGVKTEFWLFDSMDFCADLKNWTSMLLADDSTPLVNSVSYGWQGDLKQIGCSPAGQQATEADLAQLAAKGITIIFASGDSGAGSAPAGSGGAKLYPSWPASSPWVTAVGATRFVDQKAGNEEMATDQFGSGGGFSAFPGSDDRSKAKWQDSAVAHFFKVEPQSGTFPPQATFNAAGRGTPDVAAIGEGFNVIVNGRVSSVGGTSASAPTFGGLVSLLNEARLAKGQKPLGFLNPFLYQNAGAFTDITKGSNAFGRGPFATKYGWTCVAGWDAATGLGVPDFQKLLSAAKQQAEVVV